jgi:hypothetical protein
MSYKKSLIVALILCLLVSGCSAFHNGKISQDLLPGKESGQVLFEDDFTDPSSGWEVINNAYELKGYSSGGYMISVNQTDSRAVSTTNLNYSNVVISVETQKITGARDTQFGLVCRFQDKFNFYAFTVSADGYAGIVRVVDGVAELLGSDQFLRVEGIKMDDGINALVAKCENDTLQLVVNGETVISANDDSINNGDAGLFVETFETADAAIVFNDFVIIKP